MLFGDREASCFREVAVLHSCHLRQVLCITLVLSHTVWWCGGGPCHPSLLLNAQIIDCIVPSMSECIIAIVQVADELVREMAESEKSAMGTSEGVSVQNSIIVIGDVVQCSHCT